LSTSRLPKFTLLNDNLDRLLRSRQRKLTNYECHIVARDKLRRIALPPNGDELPCVTTLHVDIKFKHDCKRAATILKDTPRVKNLAITFSRSDSGYGFIDTEDRTSIGRIVVDLLFGAAYADRGPLKLTALRFDGMRFASAGEPLSRFVALEDLQHLQLLRCDDVHPFLEALTQRCSGLQSFVLKYCSGRARVNAIDNFLRATTPKRLVLRTMPVIRAQFEASETVNYDTLAPYAHTIQCLELDDSFPRQHVSSQQRRAGSSTSFRDLCKSFQSLQQLCIKPPTISKKSVAWGEFLQLLVCTYPHYEPTSYTNRPYHRTI